MSNLLLSWIFVIPVLSVATTQYTVTDQRVTRRRGILSKRTDNLELYRVSDFAVNEPLLLRIFGKVNVVLRSSDLTHPEFVLRAVPKLPALTDGLRQTIEDVRGQARRPRRGTLLGKKGLALPGRTERRFRESTLQTLLPFAAVFGLPRLS